MRILRILCGLIAALPIAAACYWGSFASRLPEPWLDRKVLGEVMPRWQWSEWADVAGEPLHVVARALHLAALHVPGATIASVVWLNVLFAALSIVLMTGLCRRVFPTTAAATSLAFGTFGLLIAAPAFGTNWLHGERAAVFLVPLMFLAALFSLQMVRGFAWRALLALLVAGAAPFCHLHGAVVFLALIPAVLGAARRAGSTRSIAWVGALLVIGNVATIFSLRTADGLGAAAGNWLDTLTVASGATLKVFLDATGSAWLDVLPSSRFDELLLGGLSWVLPLLVWWLGDRSPAARAAAAPGWACVWFGLLLVVVHALRHELTPPVGSLREAMLGAYLLPIGTGFVLAARLGPAVLTFGAGALLVLAAQDWLLGLEDLRLARMRTERVEAAVVLQELAPDSERNPVRGPKELLMLQELGWVPPAASPTEVVPGAFDKPAAEALGVEVGAAGMQLRGRLRSSLRVETVQRVFAVARIGEAAPAVVANVRPEFAGVGRMVPWQIELTEPLPDGARVRVVGFLVRSGTAVALGPTFVLQDGKLVVAGGS